MEAFYYNIGLPFDWAPEFGALVVFGEHRHRALGAEVNRGRYYGHTMPFGNASFQRARDH